MRNIIYRFRFGRLSAITTPEHTRPRFDRSALGLFRSRYLNEMERDDRIDLDSCTPPTLREASEDGRVQVAFRVKSGRLTAIIVPDVTEPQFTDISHAMFLSMVHDDVVSFDVDIDAHSDREEGDL